MDATERVVVEKRSSSPLSLTRSAGDTGRRFSAIARKPNVFGRLTDSEAEASAVSKYTGDRRREEAGSLQAVGGTTNRVWGHRSITLDLKLGTLFAGLS